MSNITGLYDDDFVMWSASQAAALRSAAVSGTNLPLDWGNLAEEIDSLGRSLRSELRNRLATIIEHLLKLRMSPADDPRAGWIETIERERIDTELLLRDNPSLRATLDASVSDASYKAKRVARIGLDRHGEWAPEARREIEDASFTMEQVLGPWLPARSGGRDE